MQVLLKHKKRHVYKIVSVSFLHSLAVGGGAIYCVQPQGFIGKGGRTMFAPTDER